MLNVSKADAMTRALEQMQQHLSMPAWTAQEKIVLSARILHAQGHDSGLAGQISTRYQDGESFIALRMGIGFEEVGHLDLLLVDCDLNVRQGQGMVGPANRFHTWIYRQRPDVNCIIHTHPRHVSALSMLGQPLQISHMDACALYDDVAFLRRWPGVPVGDDEGQIISAALGSKRAILLAHHGLLVACGSIEEACVVAMLCERAAALQLLASASGTIQPIDPVLGKEAHEWLLRRQRIEATFHYFARSALRQFPDCLAQPTRA